jgi:hypothetical protein
MYIAPTQIRIDGIADLGREIFGPVLHIAIFKSIGLDKVTEAVSDTDYGLTFGLHTRIDEHAQYVSERIAVAPKRAVETLGGVAAIATDGIDPETLASCPDFGGVLWWVDMGVRVRWIRHSRSAMVR